MVLIFRLSFAHAFNGIPRQLDSEDRATSFFLISAESSAAIIADPACFQTGEQLPHPFDIFLLGNISFHISLQIRICLVGHEELEFLFGFFLRNSFRYLRILQAVQVRQCVKVIMLSTYRPYQGLEPVAGPETDFLHYLRIL